MQGQADGAGSALSDLESRSFTPAAGELDSKFHAPTMRPGVVARTMLVDRLLTSDEPVITVFAPPGYGKTTLLAQWAGQLDPRVAWVSCEKTDNDPVALWTAVITALGQIAPVSPAASQLLAVRGKGGLAHSRLANRARCGNPGAGALSTASGPALSSSQPRHGPRHTVDTCM
jgi:hypothetical protein